MEQAGFRTGRNCCDQVWALSAHIEAGFQKNVKTCVAFMDLSSVYDTVWKKGMIYKLQKTIPCAKTSKLIQSMLSNRRITVQLNGKVSRPRTIKNGLPRGSVLAPLLFNIYTNDMPQTDSRKFIYADDLALSTQHKDMESAAVILSSDLSKLDAYYKKWRLQPNPSKSEVCAFHLSNRLANQELDVVLCGSRIRHNPNPTYLGVTLNRSLTYRKHVSDVSQKVKSRNNMLRKLADNSWGASGDTLRTAALALAYSTAEYCAPVWYK